MAIKRDISAIKEKINSFSTKEEKIYYINQLLFNRQKALSEFERHDRESLERLKDKTKEDFEKYQNEFDNGRLIYLQPATFHFVAEKLGLSNIKMLCKRLELENSYKSLIEEVEIIEALKVLINSEPPHNKTQFSDKDKIKEAINHKGYMKKLILDQIPNEIEEFEVHERECVKQLEGIENFKDKLQFINNNICSLARYGIVGRIAFQNNLGELNYVYCGCENCRILESFNPEHVCVR